MSSLRGDATIVARAIEAPPPPTYQEIPTELDSDTVEIQSPAVINAAQSIVAVHETPVVSGGEALSLPEKKVIDNYLPEDLSSLTLEDDHGVSTLCLPFCALIHLYASSGDITSRKLPYVAVLN